MIGVDPIIAYTCQVQVPDTTDDWALAGGLRGAPIELVKCKTCDVKVPATAEVVIELRSTSTPPCLKGRSANIPAITRGLAEAGGAHHRDHPP